MVFPLATDKINKLPSIVGKRLRFRIRSWSSVTANILIRGITESEEIFLIHTTNSNRVLQSSTFNLSKVPIFITALNLADNLLRGEVFVRLDLEVGGRAFYTLAEGYVTDRQSISWPGGVNEDSFSGKGNIRSITGTNPAAGVDISETVPSNAIWEFKGLHATLVSDATAINRQVTIIIDDGVNILYEFTTQQVQGASLTTDYIISSVPLDQTRVQGNIWVPIPARSFLPGGYRIRIVTANLQAGDNWGAPQLSVEEWLEEIT